MDSDYIAVSEDVSVKKNFWNRLNVCLSVFTLCLSLNTPLYAQDAGGAAGGDGASEDDLQQRTMQDASTVAFCGLGGAILGLSTLSFVDKPGDHLKNILVGGAVGLIVGVGIVAFFQAKRSRSDYGEAYIHPHEAEPENFDAKERLSWHQTAHQQRIADIKKAATSAHQLSFQFSF